MKHLLLISLVFTLSQAASARSVLVEVTEKSYSFQESVMDFLEEVEAALLVHSRKKSEKRKESSKVGLPSNQVMAYTRCSEIEEQKNAFLCSSYTRNDMNDIFYRVYAYHGGATYDDATRIPLGTVLPNNELVGLESYLQIGGARILRSELKAFYDAVDLRCGESEIYCLNPAEAEFKRKFYEPMLQRSNEEFAILSFAYQSPYREMIITHEVMHLQYTVNQKFKEVVQAFWSAKVPSSVKEEIYRTMETRHYDPSSPEILDEIQAFLLESRASEDLLQDFVSPYQQLLKEDLKAAGVAAFEVRWR